MPRGRSRQPINVENVKAFRARGVSYEEIAAKLGRSPSAIWRALNQPGRKEVKVPAGAPRTVYLSDELWEALGAWSSRAGTSRSRVVSDLIQGQQEYLAANEPLFSEDVGGA